MGRILFLLLMSLIMSGHFCLYAQETAVPAETNKEETGVSSPTVSPSVEVPPELTLSSPLIVPGGPIPDKYTCQGPDINPPLVIENIPQGTKSLALVVEDVQGYGPWVHWVVFNIPAEKRVILENSTPGTQALNDFGNFYYNGPCLADTKQHKFTFTVYALDSLLQDVNEGSTKETLEKAMKGKVLAEAVLEASYQNAK